MPTIVHDEKVKVTQEQLDRNEWIKSQLSNISKVLADETIGTVIK